ISYTGGDGNDVVLTYAGAPLALFHPPQGALYLFGTEAADSFAIQVAPQGPNPRGPAAVIVTLDGSPLPILDASGQPCGAESCPTADNVKLIVAELGGGDDNFLLIGDGLQGSNVEVFG